MPRPPRLADVLASPPPTSEEGEPISVSGWVRSRRDSKAGVSFIDLVDGSTLTGLQVVAPSELVEYEDVVKHLTTGCSIAVEGQLLASPGRGQAVEVRASAVRLLGAADPEAYPIQKQATSLEHLRTIPHLRSRTRTMQAVMRVRSELAHAIHSFFHERGFVLIHTPIITASDCEGAGAQFRVTTLDPTAGKANFADDFFGREAHLTVSGQLEGETQACALRDIYTFGPTFRAENSNTARHLSEFWMVEPEMAFCDLDGDCAVAEDFVRTVISQAIDRCAPELELLEKQHSRGLRKTLDQTVAKEFARVTYTEAVERLEKSGKSFEFPVAWGSDLQSEHERFLVEQVFRKPVIVTDYPREIKAFYMRANDDGRTVAALDVLVPGMGELIGGSQREERLGHLEARLDEAGLDHAAYREYLDLRRFGSVPHAGFGLGFERLVCLVTGMTNIRDVIAYPRYPGHCP